MALGSNTGNVAMINLVMTGADGAGGVWQDPVQLVPLGMNDDPVNFVASIRAGLPLVNNLRVLFNEYSFNPDGSLHPQMEAFLAAAAAQGFDLTIVYGGGDAQNIGIGNATWPGMTNSEAYAALEENYADVSGAWNAMLDWMAAHSDVQDAVYGWELMNESAGYRHSIRANGAGDGLTAADFVQLYADHAIALSQMIDARVAGNILVGGWGYNGDFLTLGNTLIDGQTALDYLRAGVGADLVWSAHLYPGWMDTDTALSPAELIARFEEIYAPVAGDNILVTEINADGRIDDPAFAPDYTDFMAASYDWFSANGIGLGWYPGVQAGASHLLYLEANGNLSYRHQHSLAHALNAFSSGTGPAGTNGADVVDVSLTTVRLRNETYEVNAGEALFDTVSKAGFAFGYGGADTLLGTDQSNDFLYGGRGNDQLFGGMADDFLFGQLGVDQLYGGAGKDALFGGAGRDVLDGGEGADYMAGGAANDSYVVDDANDTVIEFDDEGTDTVRTDLVAYTLSAHVENLIYSGIAAFAGTGNAQDNSITGGDLNDRLSGMAGADILFGGAGNDTLTGGAGADRLNGGQGTDYASYENATAGVVASLAGTTSGLAAGDAAGDLYSLIEGLRGSGFGDMLTGNNKANSLFGLEGDDTLFGGAQGDRMYGGAGADIFIFALGCDGDRVMDFEDNIDTLAFQGFAGVTTAAEAMGFATQSGADVLFNFGGGDWLRILRTDLSEVADDILILT